MKFNSNRRIAPDTSPCEGVPETRAHLSGLTAAELLALHWSPEVWAMYESLLQSEGSRAAIDYLYLQQRLDTDPTLRRSISVERMNHDSTKALEAAIVAILHPCQRPLSLCALQVELSRYRLHPSDNAVQRICSRLLEEEELVRFTNPFRGNQYAYCHALYRAEPAINDRVVELRRRRSHPFGVVEQFQVYRLDGKIYPVVRWEDGLLAFANPKLLVVVNRPEPFSQSRGGRVQP